MASAHPDEVLVGDDVVQTPELGKLGITFDSREEFSEHCKAVALRLGFRLASRGSYPKKLRQDLCLACTIGRKKAKPAAAGASSTVVPEQVACPVVVTAKWQVNDDGTLREGGRFEIAHIVTGHNHRMQVEEEPVAPVPNVVAGGGARKRKKIGDVDDAMSAASTSDVEEDERGSVMGEGGPSPPARLPEVGDCFKSWEDFRLFSRLAADSQGFNMSTAQSKGSSGTVVLRCSRFRDVGGQGSKMSENGCPVMFKLTKSKRFDGFEVVQTNGEHNHACTNFPVPTKSKKKRQADPPQLSLLIAPPALPASYPGAPDAHLQSQLGPHGPVPGAPSPGNPGGLPFLFDPYTGQRLSAPPVGIPGAPPMVPDEYAVTTGPISTYPPRGGIYYPYAPGSGAPPLPIPIPNATHFPPPYIPSYPIKEVPIQPLNVRFPAKAHTNLVDFLSALSPNLLIYASHFQWAGIDTTTKMLEMREDELDSFLDEIDTAGIGIGEGLVREDKDLIVRGVLKLRSVRLKGGRGVPKDV